MSQDIRICFVGDSFVNGTCDRTYLGWTGLLCVNLAERGLAVTHYNLGIRGDTSADIDRRWELETAHRLKEGYANRLVFSFGTNDTTFQEGQRRVELTDSLHHTKQILSVAQQKYPVLMVGPPPILEAEQNDRTKILSDRFGELCADLKVPYLNIFTSLGQSVEWLAAVRAEDGAHPGADGYIAIANLIEHWPAWSAFVPSC
ncbi:MAG: lipase [Acaryochloridaceae cyanobacterium RU_4_10]|nr:lipase [Acaryochloridaceae cyanobacterium RU_4_10]